MNFRIERQASFWRTPESGPITVRGGNIHGARHRTLSHGSLRSARERARSVVRSPPFYSLRATRALPFCVCGPVDFPHRRSPYGGRLDRATRGTLQAVRYSADKEKNRSNPHENRCFRYCHAAFGCAAIPVQETTLRNADRASITCKQVGPRDRPLRGRKADLRGLYR
jgi:hypothetical protein